MYEKNNAEIKKVRNYVLKIVNFVQGAQIFSKPQCTNSKQNITFFVKKHDHKVKFKSTN